MFKFQVVIFAILAGAVAVAVDYSQQARTLGLRPMELSAEGYVDTLQSRFNKTKAEKLLQKREIERKALWRQPPRDLLPEAPEGWTRRAFDEDENVAIIPDEVNVMSAQGVHPLSSYLEKANPAYRITGTIGSHDRDKYVKKIATKSWVYERGNETLFVELDMIKGAKTNSLTGMAATTMRAMSFSEGVDRGFAVVGGVGFTEALDAGGKRARHYRILQGHLGLNQELVLHVHANASTASTYEILNAIDYDALNQALSVPMRHVSNEAAPVNVAEPELAQNMLEMKTRFLNLLASEAQYRLGNMDAAALVLSTYVQGYTGVDGAVDLTAGEVPDLTTLIQMGYRKAMQDLMEGGDPDEVYAQIRELMEKTADPSAVTKAQEGEMSPELREELAQRAPEPAPTQVKPRKKASAQAATSGGRPIPRGKKVVATKPIAAEKAKAYNSGQPEAVLGMKLAVKRFEERIGAPQNACAYVSTTRRVECIVDKDFGVSAAAAKSKSNGGVKVNRLGTSKSKKKSGCGAGQFCSANN